MFMPNNCRAATIHVLVSSITATLLHYDPTHEPSDEQQRNCYCSMPPTRHAAACPNPVPCGPEHGFVKTSLLTLINALDLPLMTCHGGAGGMPTLYCQLYTTGLRAPPPLRPGSAVTSTCCSTGRRKTTKTKSAGNRTGASIEHAAPLVQKCCALHTHHTPESADSACAVAVS
jgi:hypothetical protein